MSAILEPETATWWERRGNLDEVAYYPRVKVVACPEDRCVTLIREYPGAPVSTESIELKLESLAEIEALLLNARRGAAGRHALVDLDDPMVPTKAELAQEAREERRSHGRRWSR